MKNNYNEVIENLLKSGAVKATKYLSQKEIIRATRRKFGGKFVKGNIEITITIGKPNYIERIFIKDCLRAKEPFPIKKVQLKALPILRKLSAKKK